MRLRRLVWLGLVGLVLAAAGCAQDNLVRPPAEPPAAPEEVPPRSVPGPAYEAYILSQFHLLSDERGKALEYLEKALELDPGSNYLRLELLDLLIREGRIEQALELARKAIEAEPTNVRLLLALGGLLANQGRRDKAEAIYRRILEIDPRQAEALLVLASLVAQDKRLAEAAGFLERMVAADPESIMGRFYLGRVYAELGRLAEAEAEFQKVVAQRPTFDAALFELAEVFQRQGKLTQAESVYKKILEHRPRSGRAEEGLARIRLRQGDEPGAIKILGGDSLRLAVIHIQDKKLDQAVAVLNRILQSSPDNQEALYYLAAVYGELGRNQEAVAVLKKIVPGAERYLSARIRLIYALQDQGALPEAVEAAKEAIKHLPAQADLYLALASVHEVRKDYAAALSVTEAGLKAAPRNVELLFRQGIVLDKLKRRDECIQRMLEVIKLDPNHAYALNYVGYSWADAGINLPKALDMIQRALSQKPDSGFIIDSLGWVYFRLGRLQEAEEVLRRAVEMLPNDPVVREHLGDILAARGRIDEARQAFQKTLELKPEEPDKIKAKIEALPAGRGSQRP